jgi:hypothetical protein
VYGRFVVGIHFQFNPAQVEPVIGQVERRGHQLAAHPLAPGVGVDHHAQAARVFEPRVQVAGDVNRANDPALPIGHQAMTAVLFALGPFFGFAQLHAGGLQQLAGDTRVGDEGILVVGVVGVKRPYHDLGRVNR